MKGGMTQSEKKIGPEDERKLIKKRTKRAESKEQRRVEKITTATVIPSASTCFHQLSVSTKGLNTRLNLSCSITSSGNSAE